MEYPDRASPGDAWDLGPADVLRVLLVAEKRRGVRFALASHGGVWWGKEGMRKGFRGAGRTSCRSRREGNCEERTTWGTRIITACVAPTPLEASDDTFSAVPRRKRKLKSNNDSASLCLSPAPHATARAAEMPYSERAHSRAMTFDDLPEDLQFKILRLAIFEDADEDVETRKNAVRVECLKRPAVDPNRKHEKMLNHEPVPKGITRGINAVAPAARLATVSKRFRALATHERLWAEPLALFESVYGTGRKATRNLTVR